MAHILRCFGLGPTEPRWRDSPDVPPISTPAADATHRICATKWSVPALSGGVAERVLQLPADPVDAPVVARRRAARRARRHVRPRGVTHLRVLHQRRDA